MLETHRELALLLSFSDATASLQDSLHRGEREDEFLKLLPGSDTCHFGPISLATGGDLVTRRKGRTVSCWSGQ